MGFVYVSNLIVGTGALTMPLAIAKAGLWISVPMLTILAVFSFMTATSVIEGRTQIETAQGRHH